MLMHRAPRLKPGSKVVTTAPAGPVDPASLRAGIQVLESLGLDLEIPDGIMSKQGYLAGNDQRRRSELLQYLSDTSYDCLWFARGGYGTMRTLETMEQLLPKTVTKLIVGFSDLTVLLNHFSRLFNLITIHGPTLSSLAGLSKKSMRHLRRLLFRGDGGLQLTGESAVVEGKATGRLCGGNLSLICSTLGTPLEVCARGRILFFEDIGEKPYRLDRMLTQLRLAGILGQAAGIAVGHLSSEVEPEDELVRVTRERLSDLDVPVLTGLEIGHRKDNLAVPIGALATLDTSSLTLTIDEPAVF
ncbi:MAG: LD-carboxypeptidase [Deltaproteobacteria bacterium]|nr:LD-carboxypeptidase [Deltaproteobacteria bacterium]